MNPNLNLIAWKQDHQKLVDEIRRLKALRRESGQPHWSAPDAWQLSRLKFQATALYILRASSRGRFHCGPLRGEWRNRNVNEFLVQLQVRYLLPAIQEVAA